MNDKPLYMIASVMFFAIAMYLYLNFKPANWLGLINYFVFFSGLMTFGWIAFWRGF